MSPKIRRRTRASTLVVAVVSSAVLAATIGFSASFASDCGRTSAGLTPVNDLGNGRYHGFGGGLYPAGSNARPPTHDALGADLAEQVTPRDADGSAAPLGGKIVFLSIGMSNTEDEFGTFTRDADADPGRHPSVVVVNGAIAGASASEIADSGAPYWKAVDNRLSMAGVTGAQVQAVWLKEANARPAETFPADATSLKSDLGTIAQILKDRFPNLWLVYLSSRIYGGYATSDLSPEPFAYQTGFAVKWLIEDQINGLLPVSATAYPWLSWGPYLWADGLRPRSDGMVWLCSDFATDGTHTSESGSEKVAGSLLDFVHSDRTARAWYENGGGPGSSPPPEFGCSLLGDLLGSVDLIASLICPSSS